MLKVKVKYENLTYYVTPVEDNPHRSNGDSTKYFMYRIENTNGQIIGCITFTWAGTARSVVTDFIFRSTAEEEIAYLALIPHLPFFPDKAQKIYSNCFRYVFNLVSEGFETNEIGYNIKVEGGFARTMQRFIFGAQPTDDQVRRQILIALHNHWLDDPYTNLPMPIVNLFVPVDIKLLTRNTIFLIGEELVEPVMRPHADPPIIETIKITNAGIKHIENTSEFSVKFPTEFVYQKFMGDNINTSTIGDNSPVVINSQNVSIAFDEIEAEIKTTDVNNKQEMLVLFGKLKNEVTKNNNPTKVTGLLGEIKKKGSWLNDKILSHPLLAQIIAQVLAKAAGLA